jgi:hypothetical protein
MGKRQDQTLFNQVFGHDRFLYDPSLLILGLDACAA